MNQELDELSPEANALLDEVRGADGPTGADRARVKKALMATIASGAGLAASTAASSAAASAATGGAAATGLSLGVKVAAALFAIGAIGTTAVVVPELLSSDEAASGAEHASAPAVTEHASDHAARSTEVPLQAARIEAAIEAAPIEAAPIEAAPIEAAPPEPTTGSGSTSGHAAARGHAAPAARRTPVQDGTPIPEATPVPDAPASTLPQEVALLRRAQRAINADRPEDALRALSEHGSRFPDGLMAEERDAARVVALCDAGRLGEARSLAARFLRERPGSPLAARVRAACP